MASVGTTGAARDKTDQDLTSHGGVLGLGLWAQSAADVRPPRAPASAPDTAEAGKDPWIRRAVTGELPEPHAPSALLELSSLDPGLGARAQDDGRAASIARGPCRTCTEERSGCITRQCWSSRLSRPGVCEGTLSVSVSVRLEGYYLRTISTGEWLAYPPKLTVELGSYVHGEAHGWAR